MTTDVSDLAFLSHYSLRGSGRFSRAPSPAGSSNSLLRSKKKAAKKQEEDGGFLDILSRLQTDRLDSQRSSMPMPACMIMAKPSTLPSHVTARHTAQSLKHAPVARGGPRRTSMSNMEIMTGCAPVGAGGRHAEPYRLSSSSSSSGWAAKAPRLRLGSLSSHTSAH